VRYLDIETDDALEMAEQTEVLTVAAGELSRAGRLRATGVGLCRSADVQALVSSGYRTSVRKGTDGGEIWI
jgi:hypothetical protein